MLLALRRHPWLTAAFLLAAALALALLVDVLDHARGVRGGGPVEPRPWMTVGYVGRSWDLDPRAIDAQAGLPTPEVAGRPLTLQEIADRRGVPVEQVIAEVEQAIRSLRGEGWRTGHDGEGPSGAENP